jgi:hypothetical protein
LIEQKTERFGVQRVAVARLQYQNIGGIHLSFSPGVIRRLRRCTGIAEIQEAYPA